MVGEQQLGQLTVFMLTSPQPLQGYAASSGSNGESG
jgi:hypothetical protein